MDIQLAMLIRDYSKELALLIEQASAGEDLFERGRKLGLVEAASLLIQEAKAFGADLNTLGLDDLLNRSELH